MGGGLDLVEQARSILTERGLVFDALDVSGALAYCGTTQKPTSRAGRYRVHLDAPANVWFSNYHSGMSGTCLLAGNGEPLTAAERQALQKRIQEERTAKERAEQIRHERRAEDARRMYAGYEDIHSLTFRPPYLVRKGVDPVPGLKQVKAELSPYAGQLLSLLLVVPAMDERGKIWTLQYVDWRGEKRFLAGARKKSCFFPIAAADGRRDGPLCVCEGIATALSIHEATGHAVLSCFDAGNIEPVAEAARRRYPERDIILCADNDIRQTEKDTA